MGDNLELIKPEQVSEPTHTCPDDDETEPLSGELYFHCVMSKTHVTHPHQLIPPARFIRILPLKLIPVVIIRGSRTWEMRYIGNHPTHKRFDSGWKSFVVDNMLKVGDICLFELMAQGETPIKFKVQVLRGDFPAVLQDKQNGSKDKPVVIDDD